MKVLHFGVLRSSSLVFVDDEVMLVTSGGHSRMIINISSRSETGPQLERGDKSTQGQEQVAAPSGEV